VRAAARRDHPGMSATELHRDLEELRLAARTVRSQTVAERRATCQRLAAVVEEHVEPDGAIARWAAALEGADMGDVDLLQELLYGLDALVRVHLAPDAEPPEKSPGYY